MLPYFFLLCKRINIFFTVYKFSFLKATAPSGRDGLAKDKKSLPNFFLCAVILFSKYSARKTGESGILYKCRFLLFVHFLTVKPISLNLTADRKYNNLHHAHQENVYPFRLFLRPFPVSPHPCHFSLLSIPRRHILLEL